MPTAHEVPGTARTTGTDASDLDVLWQRYEADGDCEALLLHYHGLVEQIARRMGADLPPFVEHGDLVSYGILGLVDAVDKFDRSRETRFATYAAIRIRGAIVDGLRSNDWVPRSVRRKLGAVARAEAALQMSLHRSPTEAELAEAAGMTVPELRKLTGEAASRHVVALDDAPAGDHRADQPGDALEAAERRHAVACAVQELSDRDRTVIDLYYYRGLKLTEIGRMLGVTEARVSQLHTRARSALRQALLAMDL